MVRWRLWGPTALGLLCVLGALVVALEGSSADAGGLVAIVILAGLGAGLYQLYQSREADTGSVQSDRTDRRARDGDRTGVAPERTTEQYPLSGTNLTLELKAACERARDDDDVEAGLKRVRPRLRETLLAVLRESGDSESVAREALADGSWTDDAVAAAVLDETVTLPDLPLRDRVRAWLFPHEFVREYVRRAVGAIDAAAAERLSTIPGERAPRPIPMREPRLDRLKRGADGALQTSTDPFAVAGERGVHVDRTDGRAVHEQLGVLEDETAGSDGDEREGGSSNPPNETVSVDGEGRR